MQSKINPLCQSNKPEARGIFVSLNLISVLVFLLRLLVAVHTYTVTEEMLYSALTTGYTMGVLTHECVVAFTCHTLIRLIFELQEHKYKRHSDISAIRRLSKIVRALVIVDVDCYLIYSRQRMHNGQVGLCACELAL